jgi:hypothetical protein
VDRQIPIIRFLLVSGGLLLALAPGCAGLNLTPETLLLLKANSDGDGPFGIESILKKEIRAELSNDEQRFLECWGNDSRDWAKGFWARKINFTDRADNTEFVPHFVLTDRFSASDTTFTCKVVVLLTPPIRSLNFRSHEWSVDALADRVQTRYYVVSGGNGKPWRLSARPDHQVIDVLQSRPGTAGKIVCLFEPSNDLPAECERTFTVNQIEPTLKAIAQPVDDLSWGGGLTFYDTSLAETRIMAKNNEPLATFVRYYESRARGDIAALNDLLDEADRKKLQTDIAELGGVEKATAVMKLMGSKQIQTFSLLTTGSFNGVPRRFIAAFSVSFPARGIAALTFALQNGKWVSTVEAEKNLEHRFTKACMIPFLLWQSEKQVRAISLTSKP